MSWTEIGSIPSETSKNTKYAISVNSEGDLGCKCMSWAHSLEKPKVCKHVQDSRAGELLRAHQAKQKPKPPAKFALTRSTRQQYLGYPHGWAIGVPESQVTKADEALNAAKDLMANSWEPYAYDPLEGRNVNLRVRLREKLRALGVIA